MRGRDNKGNGGIEEMRSDVSIGVMAVEPSQKWWLLRDGMKDLRRHCGQWKRRRKNGGRVSPELWGEGESDGG